MAIDETTRQLANFIQGKPSQVVDHGSHGGMLNGHIVIRSHGDVYHRDNRVAVVNQMVFKNGDYQGSAE